MENDRKQQEMTAETMNLKELNLLQASTILIDKRMEQNEELAELRADTSLEKQEIANDARFEYLQT